MAFDVRSRLALAAILHVALLSGIALILRSGNPNTSPPPIRLSPLSGTGWRGA